MTQEELSQANLATNAQTWDHINQVMKLLAVMQWEISKRMFTHDRSKLVDPEVGTFTEFTPKLKNSTYGSEEYKGFLKAMGTALEHHYAHNRHHPEYFKDVPKDDSAIAHCDNLLSFLKSASADSLVRTPDDEYVIGHLIDIVEQRKRSLESGVNGMNIIDLLEMIVDWKAATMRHADGDINRSIEINADRFGLSSQLVEILKNSVPLLQDVFVHLNTQKDL